MSRVSLVVFPVIRVMSVERCAPRVFADSILTKPDFESRQERREIFFSGVNFVCCLLFCVCSTPVLAQWHIKDPGHSAKVQVAGYI